MVAQTISLIIMLVAILAGILFSNRAVQELKADLKGDFKDLKADFRKEIERLDSKIDGLSAKLEVIQADLRQFYHLSGKLVSGKLEGRIDTMEKHIH